MAKSPKGLEEGNVFRVEIDKIPVRNLRTMLQFGRRFGQLKDPIAVILLIHLYAEYWLGRLLEKKGKSSKKISTMTFKGKLDKVKELGLLSNDKLWTNLKLLNDVRNNYAHQWEYNFLTDYRSQQSTIRFQDKAGQDIREELLEGRADDMQIIVKISQITATWLSEHCFTVHKIILG